MIFSGPCLLFISDVSDLRFVAFSYKIISMSAEKVQAFSLLMGFIKRDARVCCRWSW